MLLLYQVGSVKIGEVVRYTVTYTPSHDRILPSPESLHLRIKNTCAIARRAAFVHGPYTLSAAAYPSTFNPNQKFANPRQYGVPEFEPMLKAGGTWNCRLLVPESIRQSAGTGQHGYFGKGPGHEGENVSWVIEVSSQVIFSTSVAVNYEILLARDEKSLNLGSIVPVIGNQAQVPLPGRISDYQQQKQQQHQQQGHTATTDDHTSHSKPRGLFSRAVRLQVEDTASLWNKPPLPSWDDAGGPAGGHFGAGGSRPPAATTNGGNGADEGSTEKPKKPKKIHLVVLTHGLHSNLGSDMLFLKESIDAGVKQAKIDARKRKARERVMREEQNAAKPNTQPSDTSAHDPNDSTHESTNTAGGDIPERGRTRGEKRHTAEDNIDDNDDDDDDDDNDEEVIVRGFSGNATRTERGIKYLGKRLARFILAMTYPDQPYLPTAKAAAEAVAQTLKSTSQKQDPEGKPVHTHSTIHNSPTERKKLYKITKISFIAHSLGGLIQMYAVAYIQKHSPRFFNLIEPINFIAMASPFLGLNHENPLYVKFALDFGLVGRTGQDLGLTWRAPTIARNGWGAIVGNLGENAHKHVYGETQPESKPLLRILPTGPAHIALKKFRNRTVYSNVVNDGIVPLRTSCLLFLDWQGLGRVDKARREAGLVETVVRSGWAELTGANVTTTRTSPWQPEEEEREERSREAVAETPQNHSHEVPQPPTNATLEDDRQSLQSTAVPCPEPDHGESASGLDYSSNTNNNPFSGFLNFFKTSDTPKSPPPTQPHRHNKIYQRSQTLRFDDPSETTLASSTSSPKSKVTNGNELLEDIEGVSGPPTTTFFESAGDVLNPTLPSVEYLIDPSKRPRTIFHDRVYHPSDIPLPPLKRRSASPLVLRQRSFTAPTPSGDSSPRSSTPQQDPSLPKHNHDGAGPTPTAPADSIRDLEDDVDSSQMKVEEKIARAYHRGLSWRKVLVKLEPDAHNNMIVRRMFANAFGWPVIHHLVEAHFSDSAAARTRDEESPSCDRAKNPADAPGAHGTETAATAATHVTLGSNHAGNTAETHQGLDRPTSQTSSSTDDAKGVSSSRQDRSQPTSRTHKIGDDNESLDAVPDLPQLTLTASGTTPTSAPATAGDDRSGVSPAPHGQTLLQSGPRPVFDRMDSVAWSERDWIDSAAESEDADFDGPTSLDHKDKQQQQHGARAAEQRHRSTGSGGSWNWTEKIVGKAATGGRSRSSQSRSSSSLK